MDIVEWREDGMMMMVCLLYFIHHLGAREPPSPPLPFPTCSAITVRRRFYISIYIFMEYLQGKIKVISSMSILIPVP